jgi:hypothetical protein
MYAALHSVVRIGPNSGDAFVPDPYAADLVRKYGAERAAALLISNIQTSAKRSDGSSAGNRSNERSR